MNQDRSNPSAVKCLSRRSFIKKVGITSLGIFSTGRLGTLYGTELPPASFQIVLIPDTQVYTRDHPEIFLAQTRWIQNNIAHRNIRFVIHLGDLVQNPTSNAHWRIADEAMASLDGPVRRCNQETLEPRLRKLELLIQQSTIIFQSHIVEISSSALVSGKYKALLQTLLRHAH